MNNFLKFWEEIVEVFYYVSLWILNNNYVLQVYSHAATLAFM